MCARGRRGSCKQKDKRQVKKPQRGRSASRAREQASSTARNTQARQQAPSPAAEYTEQSEQPVRRSGANRRAGLSQEPNHAADRKRQRNARDRIRDAEPCPDDEDFDGAWQFAAVVAVGACMAQVRGLQKGEGEKRIMYGLQRLQQARREAPR